MIHNRLIVNLGPEWVKKAMVVSHERSGTHFLMNTLADNFKYVSSKQNGMAGWINLDMDNQANCYVPENIKGFLVDSMKGKPVLNIIKSHHPVDFFLPVLPEILEEFHVFYIYREGGEVMDSFCRHLNAYSWDAGPKVETGRELAQTEPRGAVLRYQKRQHPTMWSRWEAHVEGWLSLPDDLIQRVIHLPFAMLRDHFEDTVKYIAHRIGRPVPKPIVKPDRYDRVVTPDGVNI